MRSGIYFERGSQTPFNGWVSGDERGLFVDGKEEGIWEFYYENGQLFSVGNFKRGNNDGMWKHYEPNGRLYKVDIWSDGKLLKRERF